MNCKQGDLAIVVKSNYGNEGKIVRCVRIHDSETHDANGLKIINPSGMRWVIDPPIQTINNKGNKCNLFTFSDGWLRPLRDNEGEDETLTWAGKPSTVEVDHDHY